MKKFYVYLFIILCICGNSLKCYSLSKTETVNHIQGIQNPISNSINSFIDQYLKATNEHNISDINKFYAQNYISGDGLKRDDVIKLIKDTWIGYPDLKVTSVIKDIRANDLYATVETHDISCGNSAAKSEVTNDAGALESESHNIFFLQRFGKSWKIVSDKVIYERTTIRFGSAKPLKVSLYAPEQVMAGESYTASLYAEIPDGMIALGSIAREPIVYPETKSDEVYRQISSTANCLERLMKANITNNNELATASIGYSEMTEDVLANPEVKLTGMAIILVRVNVVPQSQFVPQNDKLKIEPDIETNMLPEKSDKKDLKE